MMGKEASIINRGSTAEGIENEPSAQENSMNEMSLAVQQLCKQLSESVAGKGFNGEVWLENLRQYVSDKKNRLLYSDISNYIFSLSDEEFSTFTTNLDSVLGYATVLRNDEQQFVVYKATIKFYDHVNLARRQYAMFSSKQKDMDDEIEKLLRPKIYDLTKDMTSQLVGLVAIFTALSFLVFGGISSLQNIFNSLAQTSKAQNSILPILIVALAWALCLMNLLFGFMYFVLRITHLNRESPLQEKNLVQRYPIVFLSNYVIVFLLTLFGGMWFAERNGIGKEIFNQCINNETGTFGISLVVFVAVFAILARKGIHLYNKKYH